MSEHIELRKVIALLAAGGEIVSHRTMPFPPTFQVEGIDDRGRAVRGERRAYDVEECTVLALVSAKLIVGRALDALWDHVRYTPIPANVAAEAREHFAHGFGQCEVCGAFPLAAGLKALTPRHGVTTNEKGEKTPCEGTGRPLLHLTLWQGEASNAA